MKTNLIKQFLFKAMAIVVAATTVFSCQKDYDDDINNLQGQIDKIITNISDLQAKLNGLTYVKSITLAADGTLTITPSTGSAITYNAKNYVSVEVAVKNGNELWVKGPKDAAAAKVGEIIVDDPVLTVDKDGYVLVNGKKSSVQIPAVKDPVLTVVNNEIYVNGKASGIMIPQITDPVITMVNNELYVNGKATGVMIPESHKQLLFLTKDADGNITNVQVKDGDKSVDIAVKSLAPLAGLLFIPEYHLWDDYIYTSNFYPLNVFNSIDSKGASQYELGYITPAFRINPTNAEISNVSWSFIGRELQTKATGDINNAIVFEGATPYGDGAVRTKAIVKDVKYAANYNNVNNVEYSFAFQGQYKDELGNTTNVVSDIFALQAYVYDVKLLNLPLSTDATGAYKSNVISYRKDLAVVKDFNEVADWELQYNATEKANLYKLAKAAAYDRKWVNLEDLNYDNYDYEFTNISYKGTDATTDQSAFINIEENGDITILQGTAAIDRLPIVGVRVFDKTSKNTLANGYIKFNIVRKVTPSEQATKEFTIEGLAKNYNELFINTDADYTNDITTIAGYDWVKMNQFYTALGVSHNDFRTNYMGAATTTTDVDGNAINPNVASFILSPNGVNVDTYAMQLNITPYSKFGENVAITTITPANKAYPIVKITWKWTINAPALSTPILAGYQFGDENTILTKGMNTGAGYKMQIYLGEAFNYAPAYRAVFGQAADGTPANVVEKVNGATHAIVLAKDYSAKKPTFNGTAFGLVDGGLTADNNLNNVFGNGTGTGILMGLNDKLVEASRSYDLKLVTNYINGEKAIRNFTVVFQNPLTLVQTADDVLIDLVNGQADKKDFAKNYNVMFGGKLMVKAGVGQDGTNNTIKAADYVDLANVTYGTFFTLELPTVVEYRDVTKVNADAKDGWFQWKNAGTRLQSAVTPATAKVKFVTEFAEISIESAITVKPE